MVNAYDQTCRTIETGISSDVHYDLAGYDLKYCVRNFRLRTPVHITTEDDGTGKHISCLEIPQVYGYGETEKESMDMSDREILSLYADIREDIPLSEEYQILRRHLDALFGNEK